MGDEEKQVKYERCKAIRAANRSFVIKLLEKTNTISSTATVSNDQYTRLDVIYRQLEAKSLSLAELDKEALSLCDIKDISMEVEESESVVARIMECKGKIESMKLRRSPVVTSTVSGAPSVVGAQARLPKLVLPTFKGDVTKWTSFWDSFKSAIHDNNQLTKIDKFNYLVSLLDGAAARAIKGLTLLMATMMQQLNY